MKNTLLVIMLIFFAAVFATELQVENQNFNYEIINGFMQITSEDYTIFENIPGAPAIPLTGKIIDLGNAAEISEVSIKPMAEKSVQLEKPLYPVQKPFALSQQKLGFTEPASEFYSCIYPKKWLQSSSLQICGNKSFATVSIYSYKYNPENNTILIPEYFEIEIITKGILQTGRADNFATASVLDQLGFSNETRDPENYLVIAPEFFEDTVQPLLDWRFKQGWNVFFRNLTDIEANYAGEDLPAKIRNCIADLQSSESIDFVTLAGDPELLPVRYAFAFDCAYGAHEGENDLACDMYYSCLDGNWNADADTLYGEDEDEVDLLPEVFVGRIPADDELELNSYISKLISYEKGLVDNYETAGGFSMELWDGSNSEICQQYIYDNYFPSSYDINFIYGDENNSENAFAIINAGQNIIQHTGHAWTNILSLENYQRIYAHDVPNFTNEWGGMLYSIGCWSNAFDYESVGEAFVCTPERNFLGYIGNSSYGWGAPGAPAFGFSEFYQKEFFSILFTEDQMELGKTNALHKLAFIPYFAGTSVFKWVGYELNLCGDSAALMNTINPRDMQITVNRINYELVATILDGGFPVQGAVISSLGERWITDENGVCQLPWNNGQEFNHSVYAKGYRWQSITNTDVVELPQINILDLPDFLEMNEDQSIGISVTNPGQEDVSFSIYAECEELALDYSPEIIYSISQGETIDPVDIGIFYEGGNNLPNGSPFDIYININDQGETLAERNIRLLLKSGDFTLSEANWDEDDFYQGNNMPVSFEFTSYCNLNNINFIRIEVQQPDEYLTFETEEYFFYPTEITEGQTLGISNVLQISDALPDDFFAILEIGITVNWDENSQWQHTYAYCMGNGNLQLDEDFEDQLLWNGDNTWQRVDTFSFSGNNSLSCRPDSAGHYYISTPLLTWSQGSIISFNYKYQMPMYGEDGFMLKLVTDDYSENIVFLGSGGALVQDENRPESQVYIEGDWQNYSFDLDEILLQTPENGASWHLEFDFFCSEIIPDFSNYAEMEEIGIFIDDFVLEQTEFISEEENILPAGILNLYPNPFYSENSRSSITLEFNQDSEGEVKLDIYDLKGRLIRSQDQIIHAGKNTMDCDVSNLPSGLYFMKLTSENRRDFSKFVILR